MFSCSERVDYHFLWLYSYQPYHVLGLLEIYICEDANFIPNKVLVIEIKSFFFKLLLQRENTFSRDYTVLKGKYFNIIVHLTGFDTRCLHSVYWKAKSKEQELILTTHETHSPQALLASSVTIMSYSIYLAELAYRETSLTLNCILAWKSIKVTKSPLPTPYFWHKKPSLPPSTRSGPKLSDKLSGFFLASLAWCPCSSENFTGTFKQSHTDVLVFICSETDNVACWKSRSTNLKPPRDHMLTKRFWKIRKRPEIR